MNIINKLTLRHLRLNKKRTLVTIIGVIISVAMITAVATCAASFMGMLQQHAIASSGAWHVRYLGVPAKNIDIIADDKDTKNIAVTKPVGYAKLPDSRNAYKPYLYLDSYDADALEKYPLTLVEGRLPAAADEIVLSKHIETNGGVPVQVGGELTLQLGQRYASGYPEKPLDQNNPYDAEDANEDFKVQQTRTFKVTGIVERPETEPYSAPGFTIITYLDRSTLSDSDTVDVAVQLGRPSRALYSHAEELAAKAGVPTLFDSPDSEHTIDYNSSLLQYTGVVKSDMMASTIYGLALIIIVIIIVGSISLIYNAFAISVSERSRYLGMLASVGATRRQKRGSVFFEGFAIGLVSIPIGLLCGTVGIGVTFLFVDALVQNVAGIEESLRLVVSPASILAAVAFSAVTIFISTYRPAVCASRISPIDALRQSQDIKLKGRTVRTSKLTRKLFGFEAELALKNLKRNKKRYRATIFSLIISIVLFLTVTSYTTLARATMELTTDEYNYDLSVYSHDTENYAPLLESISYEKAAIRRTLYAETEIAAEKVPTELKEMMDSNLAGQTDAAPGTPETYTYSVNIVSLDEKAMREYVAQAGADYDQLDDAGNPSAILIGRVKYRLNGRFMESAPANLSAGDAQPVSILYYDEESDETQKKPWNVQIDAVTDALPLGSRVNGDPASLTLVVTPKVFDALTQDLPDSANSREGIFLTSKDPDKTEAEITRFSEQNVMYRLGVTNISANRQEDNQLQKLILVFVYGFIVLITCICVANIFNTISTSVALRRREFAMLKSVGMTPKGFNRMIRFESLFYGLKSLLYGLPLGFLAMYLFYNTLSGAFDVPFTISWGSIAVVVVAVFAIVSVTMLYSSAKMKKENIVDALKEENA